MKSLGLVAPTSMNHLHKVTITLRSGEFISTDSTLLVEAPTATDAADYGCYYLSRDPANLEWDSNEVLDLNGEVALSGNATLLPIEDHEVMIKHFTVCSINYGELHQSNNYLESIDNTQYAHAIYSLLDSKYEGVELQMILSLKDEIINAFEVGLSVFSAVDLIAKSLQLSVRHSLANELVAA